MRYDLVDLRLFLLVAESGSITQGAARAGLALASASARIKGMEADLGTALIRRHRRGIVLTPAGQALQHHAQAISNQIEAMAGDLGAYAKGFRARVRLLCNTAAASEVLANILPSFLLAHPHVDVDLEERASHAIPEAIASGAADLGIAATSTDLAFLEHRPFRVDRLVVIAPRDWPPLQGARGVNLDAVLGQRFVGLGAGNPLQEQIVRQAARLGHRLDVRIRVPSLDHVCQLVAHGVGVAIVPESAVRRSGRARKLRSLRLQEAWATRTLTLCARRFADLTPQAADLAAALTAPLGGAGKGKSC